MRTKFWALFHLSAYLFTMGVHARYYDPTAGRFISPDTFVQNPTDPQTLNRYAYVRNNPLIYTDPSGHFFFGAQINVAVHAINGSLGDSNDKFRRSYQGEIWSASIVTAALTAYYGAPVVANGVKTTFPGTWEGAGLAGQYWPYYAAAPAVAWGADRLGAHVRDARESPAELDRRAGLERGTNRNHIRYHLRPLPPPSGPRRELLVMAVNEEPRISLNLVETGDMFSNAAFGLNVAGVGFILAGGPAGLPFAEAAGVGAGVLDLAAAGSYFADYRLTGNQKSFSALRSSLTGVVLDVGTANLGSVAAKSGRYGLRYSSELTGRFIRNDLGLMRGVRPHLQSIIYGEIVE